MDVLEHLPDPLGTMAKCLEMLKPDGMLLIQTPNSPFLAQLKSDEHLYLLGMRAIRELFARLGAPHLRFEPAIFAEYDMFLAVSRAPLAPPCRHSSAAESAPAPLSRITDRCPPWCEPR